MTTDTVDRPRRKLKVSAAVLAAVAAAPALTAALIEPAAAVQAEPLRVEPRHSGEPAHTFVPSTAEELAWCLSSPMWRLCSGQLYKILVKSSADDEGTILPFKPNREQRRLYSRLWYRNIILKARQLGFTTAIAILFLDHALFNANQRCAMVAQDQGAAEMIFRDKVVLAFDKLPESLLKMFPVKSRRADELLFGHNNSSIRVATSARSGTTNRLHISEFGKICAQDPRKADEVIKGSIPSVPIDGMTIIESTAEGQAGHFFKMTERARGNAEQGRVLTPRHFRFHFAAWWQEPTYRLESGDVPISPEDHEYFDGIELQIGRRLDIAQRRWWVATRDEDFSGEAESMWQEYPSTALEAFQVSTKGTYYAVQLRAARRAGRIGKVPHVDGIPVNTFWDIGGNDGTGIWYHQRIGASNHMIGYDEAWDVPYSHFATEMQRKGWIWGTHHLPHDAGHKRQRKEVMSAALDDLVDLKIGGKWVVVPKVDDVMHGIKQTRALFSTLWFDEAACKEGLIHLANYRKTWNAKLGVWMDEPRHDEHSEAADALRQMGQGYAAPLVGVKTKPRPRNWRTQ